MCRSRRLAARLTLLGCYVERLGIGVCEFPWLGKPVGWPGFDEPLHLCLVTNRCKFGFKLRSGAVFFAHMSSSSYWPVGRSYL
jgi:hypothetical protein